MNAASDRTRALPHPKFLASRPVRSFFVICWAIVPIFILGVAPSAPEGRVFCDSSVDCDIAL